MTDINWREHLSLAAKSRKRRKEQSQEGQKRTPNHATPGDLDRPRQCEEHDQPVRSPIEDVQEILEHEQPVRSPIEDVQEILIPCDVRDHCPHFDSLSAAFCNICNDYYCPRCYQRLCDGFCGTCQLYAYTLI